MLEGMKEKWREKTQSQTHQQRPQNLYNPAESSKST